MKAAPHPRESARLAALRRYDILDTPRESDFDDIVMLASHICETPISVINLIDADRQWFKAETGLGVRETPLATSICAHVILEEEYVEIRDTLDDPRMCDNALCLADPGLRFYAGALLRSPDGHPIGTLCVLDYAPRVLNQFKRHALHALATQVMAQLDLRAIIARQTILQKEIDHRVKNSLQTVSAFVALERGMAQGPEADDVLQRVGQQINSVALLHEFLGTAADNETVDLSDYLARVIDLIDVATPGTIVIDGQFAPCIVDAKKAAVLGTILNELIANSIKHSFAAASGNIRLSGVRMEVGVYRIICADDGQPSNTKTIADARGGLGLAIIEASVQQLNGTVTRFADRAGFKTVIDCAVEKSA